MHSKKISCATPIRSNPSPDPFHRAQSMSPLVNVPSIYSPLRKSASVIRDAEDVFQEFSIVRSLSECSTSSEMSRGEFVRMPSVVSEPSIKLMQARSGVVKSRTFVRTPSAMPQQRRIVDDDVMVAPIIPRSRLPFALARLRLHFSESELSAEIALSSSRAGLNRDEFTRFVQSNINRRASLERTIVAFLELQPSGEMGIEELRAFILSDALYNDAYGERNSEPLTADEFDIFRGHVDPRGEGVAALSRVLGCFFPTTSPELVENLLEKHGVGATHRAEVREEKLRQEADGRRGLELWEQDAQGEIAAQFAEEMLVTIEVVRRREEAEEMERQRVAAELRRQQLNKEARAAIEDLECNLREAMESKEVKRWKKLLDAHVHGQQDVIERIRRAHIRRTKAVVGCCRVVNDVELGDLSGSTTK